MVQERTITICDNYIDMDRTPTFYKFNRKTYRKCVCVSQDIYNMVTQEVWRAEKDIENLIENSILEKRPYQKGDCVVDRNIKSLCLGTDEVLTYCCRTMSYHPYTFGCEDGPMNMYGWEECSNVNPAIFDEALTIWKNTTKSIMQYCMKHMVRNMMVYN